jgi:steroid delta-isomerase-like uncharacterized protein
MAHSDSAPNMRPSRSFRVRGGLLRLLRLAREWSQEEAADEAGLSDRLIRKAEAGGPIRPNTVAALAKAYGSREAPLCAEDLLAEVPLVLHPITGPNSQLLARWLDDIWNKGRLETIDELVADSISFHCEVGVLRDVHELRERIADMRQAFREFRLTMRDIRGDDDRVVCRWRMSMIHAGVWRGILPTNRLVSVEGITTVRIHDGRIVEGWEYWDPQLIYQQLAQ